MLCLTHLFNLSIRLFITDHKFLQKARHQTCLSWRYHRNFVRLYHEFLSEILWDKIEKKLNRSKLLRFGALQNVQISRNQFLTEILLIGLTQELHKQVSLQLTVEYPQIITFCFPKHLHTLVSLSETLCMFWLVKPIILGTNKPMAIWLLQQQTTLSTGLLD